MCVYRGKHQEEMLRSQRNEKAIGRKVTEGRKQQQGKKQEEEGGKKKVLSHY